MTLVAGLVLVLLRFAPRVLRTKMIGSLTDYGRSVVGTLANATMVWGAIELRSMSKNHNQNAPREGPRGRTFDSCSWLPIPWVRETTDTPTAAV
jgi:hypothetical protein